MTQTIDYKLKEIIYNEIKQSLDENNIIIFCKRPGVISRFMKMISDKTYSEYTVFTEFDKKKFIKNIDFSITDEDINKIIGFNINRDKNVLYLSENDEHMEKQINFITDEILNILRFEDVTFENYKEYKKILSN